MNTQDYIGMGNFIVLLITAIIIFYYTKATFALRKLTEDQNELSTLPILAIYFRGESTRDRRFRIRNLGNGVALSIKIENTRWILTDTHEIYELRLSLPGTNILSRDEERDLTEKVFRNGVELVGHSMLPHLDPEFSTRNYKVKIRFENMLGGKYITIIQTGRDGVSIIKSPTKQ